ncbi:hypothetical protein [uncultured Hyphomonas sp.]|jgi:hypothetical protein|uniref:hypothetical protein n=1 Tax=uncultured Hyphomonas sp. TaxID=225298 RepID=UPI000C651678|nr:hypothetical protein [Hyphomonadaceae bacterium]MBA27247.1 hypothetical protein [Hyphomonadaceae bacterium]|tara:strand:- start:6394 stop:6585 length:192 start_codon:yes stop_codon:yes gene_type:complete
MQEKRRLIFRSDDNKKDSPRDPLRDALRKSFEDSLKAPPSPRLEDLMAQLRTKERTTRPENSD